MHEGHTPDRTDHRRAAERRRREQRGPTPGQVADALDSILTHAVPGTPPVGALRVLAAVHSSEWATGDRRVRDFSITDGRPEHGALRSDDHVGRYTVDLPLAAVASEAHEPAHCPECGHDRGRFKYRANHHLAGSESVTCLRCEAVLYSDDWE